ncbi:MAG: murein hydrolase activator EnvC family protein [Actinomycetota bacterium]
MGKLTALGDRGARTSGRRRPPAPTRIAAGLVLALACAGAALPATAGPRDRLERIQDKRGRLERKIESATQRKGKLLDRIGVVDQERGRVEGEVDSLDARITQLNARIADVSARLKTTQQTLAVLEAELKRILHRLVTREDLFVKRAVAVYKAGPTAYLDTLLSAETLGDLIDRYAYYEGALDADAALLDEIDALRNETDAKRDLVEKKEEQIAADKRRLEADRSSVAAVRAQRADALVSLETALTEKRQLVATVESRRKTYAGIVAQLDRESDQIASLLAARRAASSPAAGGPPGGSGRCVWPAPGPITSGYGYRVHPIFGTRRMHTGVDIGAPYGATVVACDSGTVAFSGVMSGYGNVIVVDHGGGFATTYNHLSGFSVGSGQSVGRGQPVGSVGCTGYCTGPHLHFEVRINGSPVDPMPYL